MTENQYSSNHKTWKKRVENWHASGQSIRRWCLGQALSPSTFSYWKNKFALENFNKEDFVEIIEEKSTGIEIRHKGFEIHVEKEFDEHTLARCLTVIRSCSC